MNRVITIKVCGECPYYDEDRCKEEDRYFTPLEEDSAEISIPEWCCLEDDK